jgi:hypothetical protein
LFLLCFTTCFILLRVYFEFCFILVCRTYSILFLYLVYYFTTSLF